VTTGDLLEQLKGSSRQNRTIIRLTVIIVVLTAIGVMFAGIAGWPTLAGWFVRK
jgi:hypothetical protein